VRKYKVGDSIKVIKVHKDAATGAQEGYLSSDLLNVVGVIAQVFTGASPYHYRITLEKHGETPVYESEIELVNKNNMVYRRGIK